MKKKEKLALHQFKTLADELKKGIVNDNLFAVDDNGTITNDAFVFSNKLLHLLVCIERSWESDEIKWFDIY